MEPQRVIWLSRRPLTCDERKLIYEIHGDGVVITSDRAPLGNDPDAFIKYIERNPMALVYTDGTTCRQLCDAVAAGKQFGFFEYAEGRLASVLHVDPSEKKLVSVRDAPDVPLSRVP